MGREEQVQAAHGPQGVPGGHRLDLAAAGQAHAGEGAAGVGVDGVEDLVAVEVDEALRPPAADVADTTEVGEQRVGVGGR